MVASPPQPDERAHWVLLTMVAGIGPVRFRRLIDVCGDAVRAWRATDAQLLEAGLERRTAEALRRLRATATAEVAMRRLERAGARAITLLDDDYPTLLRAIADPPPVLYVRGELPPDSLPTVALVGTRRATPYGRAVAERLAADLASLGVVVVSGLAKGVDTVAHRACVEAAGCTLAVLGNGLDQVYPPENTALARRIVEEGRGAVVSEFPPGVPPDAVNFPRRNRVIAGLSRATVIVEAGLRSGALITADFALEQGRDVLAVPGSILSPHSQGANLLIKQGAPPVTGVEDVLEALGLTADAARTDGAQPRLDLDGAEAAVYDALGAEPRHVDDVARATGRGAGEVSATLALLELRGLVRNAGAMAYVRA